MARTAGSISLVNVNFQDLLQLVGDTYNGNISVSLKWLQIHKRGVEQFTLVKRSQLGEGIRGLDVERSANPVPPPARPRLSEETFEIED